MWGRGHMNKKRLIIIIILLLVVCSLGVAFVLNEFNKKAVQKEKDDYYLDLMYIYLKVEDNSISTSLVSTSYDKITEIANDGESRVVGLKNNDGAKNLSESIIKDRDDDFSCTMRTDMGSDIIKQYSNICDDMAECYDAMYKGDYTAFSDAYFKLELDMNVAKTLLNEFADKCNALGVDVN